LEFSKLLHTCTSLWMRLAWGLDATFSLWKPASLWKWNWEISPFKTKRNSNQRSLPISTLLKIQNGDLWSQPLPPSRLYIFQLSPYGKPFGRILFSDFQAPLSFCTHLHSFLIISAGLATLQHNAQFHLSGLDGRFKGTDDTVSYPILTNFFRLNSSPTVKSQVQMFSTGLKLIWKFCSSLLQKIWFESTYHLVSQNLKNGLTQKMSIDFRVQRTFHSSKLVHFHFVSQSEFDPRNLHMTNELGNAFRQALWY
jgi:hypothetical protein